MPADGLLDIDLAYGRQGLRISLPADVTTVVAPAYHPAVPDVPAVLRAARPRRVAGPPLRAVVRPGRQVAVSVCDVTRPQPREAMLRALLAELEGLVTPDDVTVLIATGTHRGTTAAELDEMLGPELAARLRVINHDARDESMLTWCGEHGDGVPVWLNKYWAEADVKITTGFVEPHFFAGFSGGPKLVAPGLAGLGTTLTLHDARRIGSEQATWGGCEGNPVHDDVRAIAAGGGVRAMHAAARAAVREVAMRPVDAPFDVVVTSNSGFPLDQNLYQAVKGMSAARQVARPGGTIICVAECRDGFPDHGSYRQGLASQPSPPGLLAA